MAKILQFKQKPLTHTFTLPANEINRMLNSKPVHVLYSERLDMLAVGQKDDDNRGCFLDFTDNPLESLVFELTEKLKNPKRLRDDWIKIGEFD